MIILPSNNATFFDVDDTLVLWNPTSEEKEKYGVEITCPGSMVMHEDGSYSKCPSWKELLVPHFTHVEVLKKHKARGHTIVVWSAGGWDWAQAAVKALGLEPYVDLVISKPTWTYDDLSPEQFMPKSQYLPNVFPEIKEKKDG